MERISISVGDWLYVSVFSGISGDPMRALNVRVGSWRFGVSNWYSWSVGRWDWLLETDL